MTAEKCAFVLMWSSSKYEKNSIKKCRFAHCARSGRLRPLQGGGRAAIHYVRQHSENASETSIWRELTASNHEIHHFSSWAQTCLSVDLRIHDVGCPELLGKLSLIVKLCSLSWASNSEVPWARDKRTHLLPQIVLLFLGPPSPWSHYYSSSFSW